MPEVAVTVDVDERNGCYSPHACERAQKDGAIAAHHDWEFRRAHRRKDGVGEREIERSDRVAVTQPRTGLLTALVSWAGKIDDARRRQRIEEASLRECFRSPP